MASLSQAGSKIKEWRENPRQFVREVLGATPDAWQDEVLEAFPHKEKMALKACKGPGKTAVEAWLALNFMVTRPKPKIGAVSISRDNLRDNFWAELAKWQARSRLLQACFTHTQSLFTNNEHEKESFITARSWPRSAKPEEQANTLAGLHADHIMFVLDESGGIPVAVLATAEAALSSCVEGHIIQAGNPTDLTGSLHFACVLHKGQWWVRSITGDPDNPLRSPRVRIEWARQQIATYGRDNPWVLVNVFGEFPPGGLNTLIGPDEVMAAFKRKYHEPELRLSARVAGVDVARFGDDASILFPRRGLQAGAPLIWRNVDSVFGAGAVARAWEEQQFDAVFVDNTGGYGGGWIDQLRVLGRTPVGVGFSEKASKPRYFNKRAEIYFEAADWFKGGGAMPECPEILAALTQTTYTYRGDAMLLEPKEMVKAKIGYSPDHADAFALTFSHPVTSMAANAARGGGVGRMASEYDPYAGMVDTPGARTEYDPYAGMRS